MPLLPTPPTEGCVGQNIPLISILCRGQAENLIVVFIASFPSLVHIHPTSPHQQCEFLTWAKSEECLVLLGIPEAVISELDLQEWRLRGNRVVGARG